MLPALAVAALLPQRPAGAQVDPDTYEAELVRMLRMLRTPSTDWSLWRDVGDRARLLGEDAVTAILDEIATAQDSASDSEAVRSRYRVRLTRVLAETDPDRGLPALTALCTGQASDVSALAVRALGRTHAPATQVADHLMEVLESQPEPSAALLLAMGESGDVTLFPVLESLLRTGASREATRWGQYSMALLAQVIALPKAREWIESADETFGLAGILIAKKFRDRESTQQLIRIAGQGSHPLRSQAILALAAIGGPDAREALVSMAESLVGEPRSGPDGLVVYQSHDDPLYLAMLRLDHPIGLRWVTGKIDLTRSYTEERPTSLTMVSPEAARIAELTFLWGNPKGRAVFEQWLGDDGLPGVVRVSLGRGLCHARDPRGIELLADVLLAGNVAPGTPPDIHGSALAAQVSLHGFVANADRPRYVPMAKPYPEVFDGEVAREVGREWMRWLQSHRDDIQWQAAWTLFDDSPVDWFLWR